MSHLLQIQIYCHKANHTTDTNMYKSHIILFLVVYHAFEAKNGYETWYLTLREEDQLRVFNICGSEHHAL